MEILRDFTNKPGIVYDAAKTYIVYAQDLIEIKENFEEIGETEGPFVGTNNLIKELNSIKNIATDVSVCSDVTQKMTDQVANIKEFKNDNETNKLVLTKDFILRFDNIVAGSLSGIEWFYPGAYGARINMDTTNGDICIYDITSGADVLLYRFGSTTFLLNKTLRVNNGRIEIGNPGMTSPGIIENLVFFGSNNRIVSIYKNFHHTGNDTTKREEWTFGYLEGVDADVAKHSFFNTTIRHYLTDGQTSDFNTFYDESGARIAAIKNDGNIEVPFEAYGATWEESKDVPTKESIYNIVENFQYLKRDYFNFDTDFTVVYLNNTDSNYIIDCSADDIVCTLPTAFGNRNKYTFVNSDISNTYVVELTPHGSETIDGVAGVYNIERSAGVGSVTLISDDTGWWLV